MKITKSLLKKIISETIEDRRNPEKMLSDCHQILNNLLDNLHIIIQNEDPEWEIRKALGDITDRLNSHFGTSEGGEGDPGDYEGY